MKINEKEPVVEFDTKLYRLIEMHDAMLQSIDNAKKVKEEQELLIDILKNSDYAKTFENFIKENQKQSENLASQIVVLSLRSDLLQKTITLCKNDSKIEETVTILLSALGVFEND